MKNAIKREQSQARLNYAERSNLHGVKIAVIVAMQKEMASLSALLNNRKEETIDGFHYVTGELDGRTLVLHQSGLGKVNAAVGASELIRNYRPDYLISSGCAGGLDSKLKVVKQGRAWTLSFLIRATPI